MRILLVACILLSCKFTSLAQQDDSYLSWNKNQATAIGRDWRVAGRVGWKMINTDVFYSRVMFYELRATLMSPEAIRAAARLEQLRRHLTDDETRELSEFQFSERRSRLKSW